MTIAELKQLKESEDNVEFKSATHNFSYAGSEHREQEERRKCFLGYVIAFANEGGGMLVLGMADRAPHDVVGSDFAQGQTGALEDETYRRLGIRVHMEELHDENGLRVLIAHIPSRPVGRMMKFEGVPLMRVGESLRNMSDEEMFAILSEQEPDFSAKPCDNLDINDLDPDSLVRLKAAYAKKQNNPAFTNLSDEQVLSDLKLMDNAKLTNATLLLLGKSEVISVKLPQAKIIWEYRNTDAQIHHDFREVITEPLFLGIDKIWQLIHQRNSKIPIQSGAYIFELYTFNEGVIREAILNAIAHRDYTISSEVVIKQYPKKIIINNPGGFPRGVTIDNIITVSSTPRSRLLTEILEKTGLVERSGQGVDKIFSITLSEGKQEPDYKDSDLFQVSLRIDGRIVDQAFHVLINTYQEKHPTDLLGVEQIIALFKIKNGLYVQVKPEVISQLERAELIIKVSHHTNRYLLSNSYYNIAENQGKIANRYIVKEVELILRVLQKEELKIGDFEKQLVASMNRNQIKYVVRKLVEDDMIKVEGAKKGTKYSLSDIYISLNGEELINKVIQDLIEKYR